MKHYLLSICLVLTSISMMAGSKEWKGKQANDRIEGSMHIWLKDHMNVPSYVGIDETTRIPVQEALEWMKKGLGLDDDLSFVVLEEETDQLGINHIKLQQYYLDYPIAFAHYKIHSKNGWVTALSGNIHQNVQIASTAVLDEKQALQKAIDHIGASIYKWQLPEEEAHIRDMLNDPSFSYTPQAELTIVPKNADLKNLELRLAYKFDIYAHQPESRSEIYIDAINGSVVFENSLIHTADTAGTAHTAFSDTVDIITDSYQGGFRLFEQGRGQGIHTWNMETRTNINSAVEFMDSDNFWDNFNAQLDEYATDAHWGAEMTYDFLQTRFGINSIDNNGFELISYVHYDNNWSNASWNGRFMRYGDGNGSSLPFTTLDISGHEIGHGLTTFNANLIYQDEMGALNESFSDIIGTCIEFFVRPTEANWLIGEDRGNPIRSMSNPRAFNDPDTYLAGIWFTGAGDNGGVHINSGVQNFWFYLLSEGGTGTNDLDSNYNVSAIGIEDASLIAWRNLDIYLDRVSMYEDARFFAIQSAVDLYGRCSPQHESTTNAWFAVGVGERFFDGVKSDFDVEINTSCHLPFVANFQNLSKNGASFEWNFGDGETSTAQNPSHTYTEKGSFDVTLTVDGEECGTDALVITEAITLTTSDAPAVPQDTVTVCPGEIATLTATEDIGTQLFWFDEETSEVVLFEGSEYETDTLQATSDYFVESHVIFPTEKAGPDSSIGEGSFSSTNRAMIFDVFRPMEIVSVLVYADGEKNRTFEVHNENGDLIVSKTVLVPDGEQRVELNFLLEPGMNYEMSFATGSDPDIFRVEENASYPYIVPGIMSITGTTIPPQSFFLYFFDWEVKLEDCVSPRTKVVAQVECELPKAPSLGGLAIYPNPARDDVFIEAILGEDDYMEVKIYNLNGQVIRDFDRANFGQGFVSVPLSLTGLSQGYYIINVESSTQSLNQRLIIADN